MNTLKRFFPAIGKFSLWASGIIFGLLLDKIIDITPFELIIPLLVFFCIVAILYLLGSAGYIEPNMKVISLKSEGTITRNRRRGLILLLSPFHRNDKKVISKEELDKLIEEKDYKTLGIHDTSLTNFGPQIKAFKTHLEKLEHCWIVTTKSQKPEGISSNDYLPLLRDYLKTEIDKNDKVQLHYGDEYTIDMTEDSAVCEETNSVIKSIFDEARKEYKLKAKEIIADITGGTASIKIGTTLTCLAKDQFVQVIGSVYDEKTGFIKKGAESYPIVIGYKPHIPKES